MGLCRCRRISQWQCFVHRKVVCENCVVSDHQNCVVRQYVDWLKDSDYPWPHPCQICKLPIESAASVRLSCMHVFHTQCLDQYCMDLPIYTAPAGYSCPTCQVPIRPAVVGETGLHNKLTNYIRLSSWAKRLEPQSETLAAPRLNPILSPEERLSPQAQQQRVFDETFSSRSEAAHSQGGLTNSSMIHSEELISTSSSIAPRKQTSSRASYPADNDDDKYNKEVRGGVQPVTTILGFLVGTIVVFFFLLFVFASSSNAPTVTLKQ
eukprot:TRINITY_DN6989_c0_g1_i1.p1 TRINITY_DN6989_c0_g1~~TRINITY_DN6989_c0_g1_i1.p1  ORF type:complete len:265 (-),score=36.45 TRINITY_DN6989_c0_g1_i1:183-977(-)